MKKYALLIGTVVALSGCGVSRMYIISQTTPGYPIPGGLSVCLEGDGTGARCKIWSNPGNECVNPKGLGEPELLVPCDSLPQYKKK